jgi:two-component system cell cycle sensor histidine kinase/response regulator CckA
MSPTNDSHTCRLVIADPDSLTRLVGEVAHDLNNLVTIIRGNCQLLFHESILPAAVKGMIQEIHKVGEQATLLTSHLTAAFQCEELPAHVQDIRGLLGNAAGMLRALLGDRHQLILNVDYRPCPVYLVPGQFERVLVNLAANARDAMPHGGTLTITIAQLDIDTPMPLSSASISGPHVLVTVTDTGTGLDENIRERLFQPLASSKAGGQGLGLAIVAKLLRQHDGHIDVGSQPGLGTSFRIFLPRFPSAEDQS